ncbi:DUF4386 family protein [Vacuolonema iberomarrocanum]|uniref:DUF4386 family protein n=1 Tax=Vacuolonema iberomarrocanum TaxID=3454632 RepID=UPI003F6DA6F0
MCGLEWIVFRCHLFTLGYLAYKADFIPKLLRGLLIAAVWGYPVAGFTELLSPGVDAPLIRIVG